MLRRNILISITPFTPSDAAGVAARVAASATSCPNASVRIQTGPRPILTMDVKLGVSEHISL